MKNFWHCKQEEGTATIDLSTLIDHLMPPQRSDGSFQSVNLGGRNVGAAMIGHRGASVLWISLSLSLQLYVFLVVVKCVFGVMNG
ncbi:hypothetical protein F0562_002379 [Nyssa sinensis]|uniref:Uncharacterized protein n=1 Tax=Nyssa sinensis TaxID=561372 RepID=A0A5J5C5L4_9ASTE|nr:hypothetical protein F0562_002379 [Nyssa sinensis]